MGTTAKKRTTSTCFSFFPKSLHSRVEQWPPLPFHPGAEGVRQRGGGILADTRGSLTNMEHGARRRPHIEGSGRRGWGGAALGGAALYVPIMCAQLAAGFVGGPAAWEAGIGRSRWLPCVGGTRALCVRTQQPARTSSRGPARCKLRSLPTATALDDEATKDAKLDELMAAFKANQSSAGKRAAGASESLKPNLQAAIMRALGEADELLLALGQDVTQKEPNLDVIQDVDRKNIGVIDPDVCCTHAPTHPHTHTHTHTHTCTHTHSPSSP